MKAVIFCGGSIEDYGYLKERSFDNILIICADRGVCHVEALGLTPDIVIGDMDSWDSDCSAFDVKIYPPEKDYTDTHLCIDCAIERGCDEIELLGGLGGRRDHEFSHYCLIAYGLRQGVRIKMSDENNEIWMEDKPFCLNRTDKKYVSFFPYGGVVEGFTVRGLKYSAENMLLSCDNVQASSNEFAECDTAEVDFESGRLLVMLCNDRNTI